MTLSMRRIVLFTKDMPGMTAFYRDVLGLKLRKDEKGWKEFDANGCVIALHNGTSQVGRRPPKIGFWAKDIAAARRNWSAAAPSSPSSWRAADWSAARARTPTATPSRFPIEPDHAAKVAELRACTAAARP
jgi:catechol 2,3-dioxygenase-like lactoylglutathione lyase family enzyme